MAEGREAEATKERVLLLGATALLAILPVALLVAPVPLAALVYRHGLKFGIGAAVLSSLFASLLTLNPVILAQVLLGLALGIALGEALRDGLQTRQILVVGTGVTCITTLLLMFVIERVLGVSPIDMVAQFWEEALGGLAGNGTEIPPEIAENNRKLIEMQLAQMRLTLPTSLVMGSLGLTVADFALTRWLLGKLGGGTAGDAAPRLLPFAVWRFPKAVGLTYLGGKLLEVLILPGLGGALQLILFNLLLILGTLLTVQGAAVVWHFLGKTRMRRGVRVAVLVGLLLFVQELAVLALLAAGLLDMWLDLRKLKGSSIGTAV